MQIDRAESGTQSDKDIGGFQDKTTMPRWDLYLLLDRSSIIVLSRARGGIAIWYNLLPGADVLGNDISW